MMDRWCLPSSVFGNQLDVIHSKMIGVRWRLCKNDTLSFLRTNNTRGTTKAGTVRNGTIKIQHSFSLECSLPLPQSSSPIKRLPNRPLHDCLIVTVHRLGSGSKIEDIGEVTIDLVGQHQPPYLSSYLLQKSSANAVLKLVLSVEPLTVDHLETSIETLTTLCSKSSKAPVKGLLPRSTSSMSLEQALTSSRSKFSETQRHKKQMAAADIDIVCKVLNDIGTPTQHADNTALH